jgi:hypothetical protein
MDTMNWRKSSYSGGNGAECVEAGQGPGIIAVRDSKDRDGPRLDFSPDAWRRFTTAVKTRQVTGQP